MDRKIDYATNSNGVFFNVSALSNDIIRDIDSIIKKYESEAEVIKNNKENEGTNA